MYLLTKFAVVWYRRVTSLELTVRKLLCSVVIQTFFIWHAPQLVAYATKVLSSFECWKVVIDSVQLWNVLHLIVPILLNRKLKKLIFRSRTKSVEISVCVTEFSSRGACHDEIIILSPPCDLTTRRTWLVVFHLLTCILKRILETIAVVHRYLVNKPAVKWFIQRCTYRNYMHARLSLVLQGNYLLVTYKKAVRANSLFIGCSEIHQGTGAS